MARKDTADMLRDAVCEVLKGYGLSSLDDPRTFYSMLTDLVAPSIPEMKLLRSALADEGDSLLTQALRRLNATCDVQDVDAVAKRIERRLVEVHLKAEAPSRSCAHGLADGMARYVGIDLSARQKAKAASQHKASSQPSASPKPAAPATTSAKAPAPQASAPQRSASPRPSAPAQSVRPKPVQNQQATAPAKTKGCLRLVAKGVAIYFVACLIITAVVMYVVPALSGTQRNDSTITSSSSSGAPTKVENVSSIADNPHVQDLIDSSSGAAALSKQKKVLSSLDGWWAQAGGLGSDTRSGYRLVRCFHDGECDTYDGDGTMVSWTTISTSQVTRLDNGPGNNGDPGWYLYNVNLFLSDNDANLLVAIDDDGSNYSMTSSYVRIDGEPNW